MLGGFAWRFCVEALDELDAAVAGAGVVQFHECRFTTRAGFVLVSNCRLGSRRTGNLIGGKQRFRVAVVVGNPWAGEGPEARPAPPERARLPGWPLLIGVADYRPWRMQNGRRCCAQNSPMGERFAATRQAARSHQNQAAILASSRSATLRPPPCGYQTSTPEG